jgi:hypothetical protein
MGRAPAIHLKVEQFILEYRRYDVCANDSQGTFYSHVHDASFHSSSDNHRNKPAQNRSVNERALHAFLSNVGKCPCLTRDNSCSFRNEAL